jgi:hypothetical protein
MLAAMLGHAMVSNYKHKEAMKEVITPFLVDQALKILADYIPALKPVEETPPVEVPEAKPVVPEPIVVEKIVEVEVEKLIYMYPDDEGNWTTENNTTGD